MEFPTDMNCTCPFPILGLLGGIFHLYSKFKGNFFLQFMENLRFAASDVVLHCLPMSYKNTWLIWVNRNKIGYD